MLPRPHPRQPTLPPSPRPTRAVRAQAARGTTLGGGGPRALPGPGGQARPASPGRRLWDAGFRAVTLRPTFGAELFLCPQAGRIRQAGHRSDRILWFHVLSPAAGRLSTGSGAVVNSSGDLSPRFSTGSRTGALTPCGEHGIVLATRPPAGRRSSLCKGKAEREPENCRGSRHGYQPQRCSRVLLGPHRSSSARPSPGVHLRHRAEPMGVAVPVLAEGVAQGDLVRFVMGADGPHWAIKALRIRGQDEGWWAPCRAGRGPSGRRRAAVRPGARVRARRTGGR